MNNLIKVFVDKALAGFESVHLALANMNIRPSVPFKGIVVRDLGQKIGPVHTHRSANDWVNTWATRIW